MSKAVFGDGAAAAETAKQFSGSPYSAPLSSPYAGKAFEAMTTAHLRKSFCAFSAKPMTSGEISDADLFSDKSQEFYAVKFDSRSNQPMPPFYGAKTSSGPVNYGGGLSLMNEFISSIILYTISNLREEKLFVAPRVCMHVEGDDKFRMLSQMVPGFGSPSLKTRDLQDSTDPKETKESYAYLAGLMAAMQEVDVNLANYGLCLQDDDRVLCAKIDTNTSFRRTPRHGSPTPIYFNNLTTELSTTGMQDREYASFSAFVAKALVFNTRSAKRDDPRASLISFIGQGGCLQPKKDDHYFKMFMRGVKDFVDMPDEFIDYIRDKTLRDLAEKSPALAESQKELITHSCAQFHELKAEISKFFAKELELFYSKCPEERGRTAWHPVMCFMSPAFAEQSRLEDLRHPERRSPLVLLGEGRPADELPGTAMTPMAQALGVRVLKIAAADSSERQ